MFCPTITSFSGVEHVLATTLNTKCNQKPPNRIGWFLVGRYPVAQHCNRRSQMFTETAQTDSRVTEV